MKRTMLWSEEDDDSSSDESSSLDTAAEDNDGSSKKKLAAAKSVKKKSKEIDLEALSRHGYRGGLSVLNVPPPKDDQKNDWSWSTGRDSCGKNDKEESLEEREKTRVALSEGELLRNAKTPKEKNLTSFSQKEKRKRDLGQASRGKNYVEEEKRVLRDNGVYSGFDS